ncbi:MAG TPA: hypothetical protein VK949_09305 [Methylotenera sp.]|nr:hypothetical protein [Methylotenera sp.]
MFRAIFLFVLLCFCSLACFANQSICTKITSEAETSGILYYPTAEAKVIENGKVSLYSSPNTACKIKGMFVIKGNYLTVYKSYKGWVNVMYVANSGEDVIGWLPESKVKIMAQYGRYPSASYKR